MENLFNLMLTSFSNTNRFRVLERERLDALMRELELQDTSIDDRTKGSQLSKLLGAEISLFGSIHENWDGQDRCLEIIARLVDIDTTEILATNDVFNRWKTREDVTYLLNGLAQKFIEDFPLIKGEIVHKNWETFEMDLNMDDLIKRGMRVLVYRPVQKDQTEQRKKADPKNEIIIGEGKVESVAKDYSSASPIPNEILKKILVGDCVITK